jgi:3-oxoacyl-[acyl-carrier protein] reductase
VLRAKFIWNQRRSDKAEGGARTCGTLQRLAQKSFLILLGGKMISLAGKAALITGGSRGIGAAAVKLFAQAGADVVFNYNKAKDAAALVESESRKHGTRVEAFKADVGRHADNKKLVDQTVARLGRIDIVVANAGVWNIDDQPIEKMTEKQWDEMVRINLKSVYSVIHFASAHMIKQKSGKIILISSTAGQRGESFHTHYGATKGAVIAFTKGLATELAPHGILVNSVAPGWVATDMSNPVLDTKAGQKMAASAIPLGRAATAEEIAGPILFLASDLANFMTGEIINVNGGSVLCG